MSNIKIGCLTCYHDNNGCENPLRKRLLSCDFCLITNNDENYKHPKYPQLNTTQRYKYFEWKPKEKYNLNILLTDEDFEI